VVHGSIVFLLGRLSRLARDSHLLGPCSWRTQAGSHPHWKGPIPLRSTLFPYMNREIPSSERRPAPAADQRSLDLDPPECSIYFAQTTTAVPVPPSQVAPIVPFMCNMPPSPGQ
jgi:hypothetical protein